MVSEQTSRIDQTYDIFFRLHYLIDSTFFFKKGDIASVR